MSTGRELTKYERFERAVGDGAREWSEHTILDGEPGSRALYLSLEQFVVQQALQKMKNPPDDWTKGAFEAPIKFGRTGGAPVIGLRLMALHIYHATSAAGYSKPPILIRQLSRALSNPKSFDPLELLTALKAKEAYNVEHTQGLTYFSGQTDDLYYVKNGYYTIEGDRIVMPRHNEVIKDHASTWLPNVSERHFQCPAQKILRELYLHLVEICLKDSRFAASSLKNAILARTEQRPCPVLSPNTVKDLQAFEIVSLSELN